MRLRCVPMSMSIFQNRMIQLIIVIINNKKRYSENENNFERVKKFEISSE